MNPVGRFAEVARRHRVAVSLAIALGFVLLAQIDTDATTSLLAPLTLWTARITRAVLSSLGMEASQSANVLSHANGFAYEIHYRCTGLVPVAAYSIVTLGCAGSVLRKVRLLAVGLPLLVALNFVRLVHLFYVGVHHTAAFDFAHSVLWQGVLILAVLLLCLVGIGKRPLAGIARTAWSDFFSPASRCPSC